MQHSPMNHVHHVASVEAAKKTKLSSILITLYDVWILKGSKYDSFPVASWVPIDHTPVPPLVEAWCKRPNVTPIAMSRFGH